MNAHHAHQPPVWYTGPESSWEQLHTLAHAMLAKERRRLVRLAAGLGTSAAGVLLCGIGLTRSVLAQSGTDMSSTLPTAVLLLIVFVVLGGFQTLRYLEQHALDMNEERSFLALARLALQRGDIDTALRAAPDEPATYRFIQREIDKIREAEASARRLAPALWGSGLTTPGTGHY